MTVMTTSTDAAVSPGLLQRYRSTRDPDAFAAIVLAHVNWVYSVARRRLEGDAHLADDVTQAVFLLLHRKTDTIRDDATEPIMPVGTD